MDTESDFGQEKPPMLNFCNFPAPGTIYVSTFRPLGMTFGQMPQAAGGGGGNVWDCLRHKQPTDSTRKDKRPYVLQALGHDHVVALVRKAKISQILINTSI